MTFRVLFSEQDGVRGPHHASRGQSTQGVFHDVRSEVPRRGRIQNQRSSKPSFLSFPHTFILQSQFAAVSKDCQALLFLKPLLMLYEDYTNDPLICEERLVKSLIDDYRAVLLKRSPSNTNYLNAYLELVENLLRIHTGTNGCPCPYLVQELMDALETMLLRSFDFELNPQTTSRSLNIIR